jgi:hypothetical protein
MGGLLTCLMGDKLTGSNKPLFTVYVNDLKVEWKTLRSDIRPDTLYSRTMLMEFPREQPVDNIQNTLKDRGKKTFCIEMEPLGSINTIDFEIRPLYPIVSILESRDVSTKIANLISDCVVTVTLSSLMAHPDGNQDLICCEVQVIVTVADSRHPVIQVEYLE